VKIYTTHLKPGAEPVLIREGFSIAAALFGWLWMVFQMAWVPAALLFLAEMLVGRITVHLGSPVPFLGLILVQGVFGRDLLRWSLSLRGFADGPVVGGLTEDAAFARLLDQRPDLIAGFAPRITPAGSRAGA
jgi:hypothetical protein